MHVGWFELSIYAAKTTTVMVVLVILYRILGKRELSQMNVYDLATIVAVANAVQNAMTQGRGELLIGLVTSGTLIVCAYLLSRFFVRVPAAERTILGQPVLILSNGRMLEDRMRHERVSRDDVLAAIRQHGLYSPTQVAMAVIEIDGSISIVPTEQARQIDSELR